MAVGGNGHGTRKGGKESLGGVRRHLRSWFVGDGEVKVARSRNLSGTV
jgi:hypothetical protein